MKQLLIDAIVGAGFRSMEEAEHYKERKLARYTGNQHVYTWEWDKAIMDTCTEPDLFALYHSLKQPLPVKTKGEPA